VTPHGGGSAAAAIDIGSNSIKMTIGRPDGRGGIEQLGWASEVVRLGEGVAATGRIDQKRVDTAIEVLHRFVAQAIAAGATRVVAVATEATRAAANGEAFLQRVRDETGIDVRVIDGDEEAALTFRGLATAVDLRGSTLIADIGGGSTEMIAAVDGEMGAARSVALGSGRLTERHVQTDPPTVAELAACENDAKAIVGETLPKLELPLAEGLRLVVVGGTGDYVVRLLPEGQPVDLGAVRSVMSELMTIDAARLAERIAIPEARARVLPAGVAIVAAIAELVNPVSIEISHSGVRAGLLLEVFGEAPTGARQPSRRGRRSTAPSEKRKAANEAANGTGDPVADPADFREAMEALIAERWAAVWEVIPVALAGEDIEGVHDVRVASRRLRAAMDVAAPVFPRRWYKALHRTAKEITSALGEVRDRDVLLDSWRADRERAPVVERPGIDRLINRVERERTEARLRMEEYLQSLLDSPLRREVEQRFGAGSEGSERTSDARERP
jgi:exopolyphosphatase/pppGpp-phosphohydrolase